jgi:hypothetical protein
LAGVTVRVSEKSYQVLQELAAQSGKPMQTILEQAIEEHRRRLFMEALNADYAALQRDPEAWAEYQKELALWECTLMDGLDPNERWTADGDVTYRSPGSDE